MRVIGYARVSTSQQADFGISLAAQRRKIEAYCSLYDLDLDCIIEDRGASGKTLQRVGFQQAVNALDEGLAECVGICKPVGARSHSRAHINCPGVQAKPRGILRRLRTIWLEGRRRRHAPAMQERTGLHRHCAKAARKRVHIAPRR